jgi:hypothetical protein
VGNIKAGPLRTPARAVESALWMKRSFYSRFFDRPPEFGAQPFTGMISTGIYCQPWCVGPPLKLRRAGNP